MKNNVNNEEIFSSIDLVSQCLIDGEKIDGFKKAIRKRIKPEQSVLDIGTGSGILALLAAREGAKKITAIEFDKFIVDVAKKDIEHNNFQDTISVIHADATNYKYPQGSYFDMVLMEMLTTGMVDEAQVAAVNNLHKQKVIDQSTILFPSHQKTFITLSNFDFTIDKFDMKMVRHLWKHNKNRYLLKFFSKPVMLNDIDFSKPIDENFKGNISLKCYKTGIVNSIYFSSKTILDEKISIDDTNSLNAPVVIPMPQRKVQKGEIIQLEINYIFGRGYQNFKGKFIE